MHDILLDFKPNRLAMINKDRTFLLCITSQKVTIKYLGPVVIYKIIGPHNYLLMTLDGRILRGLFEHERLKPTSIRTSQGNVQNLAQLKQIMNAGLKLP